TTCGMIAVAYGGQRLARELGERRGLIPADSRYRMVLLSGRVIPGFPRRWSRPAGPVRHSGHALLPRDHPTILHERIIPELPAPVTAPVHETLELAVRHLAPVHQVVAQRDRLDVFEAGEKHVTRATRGTDPTRRPRTIP